MKNNTKIIPIITLDDAIFYVSEHDFYSFIEKNSNIEYDGIVKTCNNEFQITNNRTFITKQLTTYNETKFVVEWINKFLFAHKFMKNIMIVFDD